jgi:hypothetical protein
VSLAYLVSDHENPSNHPIYAIEYEIGSSIFHISDKTTEASVRKVTPVEEKNTKNSVWKMYFDGSCSKEGFGMELFSSLILKKSFLCHTSFNLTQQTTLLNMRIFYWD